MKSAVLFPLSVDQWNPIVDTAVQIQALSALENGKVIYLPNLPFSLTQEEQSYLRPDSVDPKTKSVKFSLASDKLWGMAGQAQQSPALARMLKRYAESAQALIAALFPHYLPALIMGNTSFRPVEAEGRAQSKRHDDRLLHVDAFPSRPNHGQRLLRVFSNIHPADKPRVWHVGEPFAKVAARFMPRIRPPFPGAAAMLRLLHITKGLRSPYDHYMLRLHDSMKFDAAYQQAAEQETVHFPPGASWVVFSDQVSHAAMSGQYMMEQTLALPVQAMANPETSPLRVLEALMGKRLA